MKYFQSGYYLGTFIASAVPQKKREDEFWEMILSKKAKIVVLMENLVYSQAYLSVQNQVFFGGGINCSKQPTALFFLNLFNCNYGLFFLGQ